MKKTLLAAALLAGFAGAASAQSSVTLYGIVDAGLRYQAWNYSNAKGSFDTSSFAMVSGQESSSRLGFRGVEDIGGGNKASFVYEFGMTPNTGDMAVTKMRQTTIGLSNSKWGNVELGRQLGLASKFAGRIDPFGSTTPIANISNSFGISTIRYNNLLMYRTPSFSGFQAGVSYSFNTGLTTAGRDPVTGKVTVSEDKGNAFATGNNQRALSVAAGYTNGPVYIFGTYDQITASDTAVTASDSISAWIVGGEYDAKVVKVALAYGQVRDGYVNGQTTLGIDIKAAGVDNPTSSGGVIFANGAGANSFLVALTAPINPKSKVFASYQNLSGTGTLKDAGAKTQNILGLGYQYAFTKRTDMMAYYTYANNYQTIGGLSSNSVGVTLRHLF
jgi:predicted porin